MPLNANQLKQIDFTSTTESIQSTINILRANISDKNSEKNVILTINSLLSNAKTRRTGLEVINTLIDHFSLETLSENVIHWANNCTVPHLQTFDKEIKLRSIEKIVRKMAVVETFSRKFVSDCLPDTLKMCLIYRSNSEKSACLRCLAQCMRSYPSWFGNHKEKIEVFLLNFLESDEEGIQDAALAFHVFQHTGSGGVDGVNYTNNFRNQLKKLCATIQVLYDDFLENVHEVDDSEKIDSEIMKFHQNSDNLEGIASRICNCLTFIKIMISRGFPVEKQIVPKYIIDIVTRGLSTHICLSDDNISLDKTNQSLLLNKIQQLLLQILRIFIIGNPSSVLPFSYVINKSLINLLKRTNNCNCFINFTNYKIATYKTLKCWLEMSTNVTNSRFQEMLVPLILQDICPTKKKITLNLSSGNKKKLKVAPSNNIETIESRYLAPDTCINALDILITIFSTHQVRIGKQLMQEVASFVLRTLADVQTGRGDPPYANKHCQLRLYQVLISFMRQEQKNVIPLHLVSTVLGKALNSTDYRISNVSRDGLDLLEKICHPVCPPLGFSEPTENQKVQADGRNEVGEETEIYAQSIQSEEEIIEEFQEIVQEDVNNHVIIEEGKDKKIQEEEEDKANQKKEITVISNIIISDSEDSVSKIKSDEPPSKKKKKQDDLDSMFASFQDIIQ